MKTTITASCLFLSTMTLLAEPPAAPPSSKAAEPETFYFTTQRLSVTSNDGAYSIPPGTRLRLIRTAGPILIVTDGKNEFEAQLAQLTKDTDAKLPEPDVFYFTTQRLSVTSNDGAYAIPPGTRLRFLHVEGPTFIVTDGKTEFAAQPSQLTMDLEVAKRLADTNETARSQPAPDNATTGSQAQQQQFRQPTMEEMQQMVELAKKIQELRNMQQQGQMQNVDQAQQFLNLLQRLQNLSNGRR